VWARKHVATWECPRSFVTPESEQLLENFLVRRQLKLMRADEIEAREAEAFLILEKELATERNDEQRRRDPA